MRLLPLGGLGEVGMNCLAIEDDNHVVIVDCGVTFDARELGVDVVHPDFSALENYVIDGVVLTHGHEDHIGALPYLLRRHDVPVYGPAYALQLLMKRAQEHEVLGHTRLHETTPRQRFRLGRFEIEPIAVTHSIVDATALCIEGPGGRILHTGDFKFDDNPVVGHAFDEARIAELARDGIDLLLSDSTNSDVPGSAGSESSVWEEISRVVTQAEGAVIVAMFASNAHRLELLGRIAHNTRRRMAFLGRSVQVHALAARRTGYLTFPEEVVIAKERMSELHRPSVLGIATGTQGEPQAALARLARGDHPDFALQAGDTVILSSRVIPGAERDVQDIVSNLLRLGVQLYWPRNQHGLHVSGHACQDEQRRMIELCAPQAFVPVHGALSHLHGHAKLARSMGISSVCVLENGQGAALAAGAVQRDQDFVSGRVHIWGGKEVAPSVLGERRALAHDGSAFVHVTVDARLAILSFVLRTRGVSPAYHHAALERDAQQESAAALAGLPLPHTDDRVIEAVRLATRRALQRATSRKPITTVALGPRSGSPS